MLNNKFYYISFFMNLINIHLFFLFSYLIYFNMNVLFEIELLFFNSMAFNFILYVDWMSSLFSCVVLSISSLILVYSKDYMANNCHRFLWLTCLFIVFMLFMISSPSILGVILGWDGLGLVSYCLVIYYQSSDAFNSGFITAASNRLGDSMLVLSIACGFMFNSFLWFEEFHEGFYFFFIACLTKSAQLPFSAWLPAAMAAPTPISSLVHSSTLVTAGVYMLIRFSNMLMDSSLNHFLTIISLVTIFLAGVTSFFENDLKRIVALSTLGQLGFMMMILSLGYSNIAFFHLLIHALFKALLFMCAGALIHSGMSIQDIRKMGNLKLSYTLKTSLSIASYSLMGIPFSSGFYSKDLLLEVITMNYAGLSLGLMMLVSAFITVSYSIRVLKFLTSSNYWIMWVKPSKGLMIPILILLSLNLLGGALLHWLIMEDLDFIALNMLEKLTPLIFICLSYMWQGNSYFIEHSLIYYFYFMFFVMVLSKNSSLVIAYIFQLMKTLDQGWLENNLTKNKNILVYVSNKSQQYNSNTYFFCFSVVITMVLIF